MSTFFVIIMLLFGSWTGLQSKTNTASEDAQLKNTVSMMAAKITQYQADNNGYLPGENQLQNCSFLENNPDPTSGISVTCTYAYVTSGPDERATVKTSLRIACDGKTTARGFSISTLLSTGKRFCIDG